MNASHSDALVFFGATGDLAYKKIFPSLQAMVKRGNLNVPVIGVAKADWNLDQLKARAKDSLEKHGGFDPAAFATLTGLLRYVDGDYRDSATFQALRKEADNVSAVRLEAEPLPLPDQPRDRCHLWHERHGAQLRDQAESVEMVFQRYLGQKDMDAYERVLTDAMAGDATMFARQDYVEEAWRIVDAALKADAPVFEYAPQSWGPREVERLNPPGGWHNPVA
jgi:glucose-6-phosphate 1-dehydrogenase